LIRVYWEKQYKKGLDAIDQSEKRMLDNIERTKKEFTGDMREALLKEMNSQLEQFRSTKERDKEKLKQGIQRELDPIDAALSQFNVEELNQPAIPTSNIAFRGFITEEEGGYYLIEIDYTYFKENLPSHAAQFLVLQSEYLDNDPGALPWVKVMREKFPYDKLKTLIDK
jgi:hypothetical protein